MAKTDRSSQFNKLQKVLKKHYEPMLPLADRSVLEHLLFALCLENSHYEKAEEVFARLQLYDDWNEVRVTSQTELSEVMGALGDPPGSAARVKGALQSVFEHAGCARVSVIRSAAHPTGAPTPPRAGQTIACMALTVLATLSMSGDQPLVMDEWRFA